MEKWSRLLRTLPLWGLFVREVGISIATLTNRLTEQEWQYSLVSNTATSLGTPSVHKDVKSHDQGVRSMLRVSDTGSDTDSEIHKVGVQDTDSKVDEVSS